MRSYVLTYPNLMELGHVFLYIFQEQLDERLNSRVDDMVSSGLVQELEKFHEDYNLDRLTENR